jgi:MinD superfamily P-loop ATPase
MAVPEHPAPRFTIDQSLCTFCGGCAALCPTMAIVVEDASSAITSACNGCGICERFCPVSAVHRQEEADDEV